MPPLLLPPPTDDDPAALMQRALAVAETAPEAALTQLGEAARLWLRAGEGRSAALALHQRAALRLRQGDSPVPDLAQAARLLESHPEERALLLLDLGQALLREEQLPRATLVLRQSERLARSIGNLELVAAARHLLGQAAEAAGDFASARDFLRGSGAALIAEAEHELVSTLRGVGNLPEAPRAARARQQRQQAVEDELARLKREIEER